MKAPFPWFGGKSRAADLIWSRLGDVDNYVEPFAGSLAVLLARPHAPNIETVNDLDGFIANFWRAVKHDPAGVAEHADNPVNECDLHARHLWLVQRAEELPLRLMGDPDYHDAKIAGWWCWGLCTWIGGGWCSGDGPWQSVDGKLTLSDAGRGVNRQLPHLGNAGQGINRQFDVRVFMKDLSSRLRTVRVACGDWSRVCGPSVTWRHGVTGVVLDPPYPSDDRADCYANDSRSVAHDVRKWALVEGENPKMRIALCGYEGEHDMPPSWECVSWKAQGGYGSQGDGQGRANSTRERIWFSPACMKGQAPVQGTLL